MGEPGLEESEHVAPYGSWILPAPDDYIDVAPDTELPEGLPLKVLFASAASHHPAGRSIFCF
jgi:hypothetical protein